MILVALLLLGTLISGCQIAQQPKEVSHLVTCNDSSGFSIEHRRLLLGKDQFNEEALRRIFARYIPECRCGERYILASSDVGFLNTLRQLPFVWKAKERHPVYDKVPIPTDDPLAYFYSIEGNSFFEYRNGSSVEWVLMEGENLFNRVFSGRKSVLVGYSFATRLGELPCETATRSLSFVVEELKEFTKEQLLEIIGYYDQLFAYPTQLGISLYNSFEYAGSRRHFVLPSLSGDLRPNDSHEGTFRVSHFRYPNGTYRDLHIWDEGRLVFSKELKPSDFPQTGGLEEGKPDHQQ